jgi:UDPglucose 6-dehydrogenase
MNELANFCEKVGADVDLVRKGMGTDSRIGKRFLFPGIGYGGSCFPKDVNALIKTAAEKGSPITLLEQVDKINKRQKEVLVDKVMAHFNGEIKGKKFAVWGLAFKPNTDDMREAPSITIINKLLDAGANVVAYDPAATENAKFHFGDRIKYVKNQYEALTDSDALLILTEWNEFRNPEFDTIAKLLTQKLIFDGRNVYTPTQMEELGFTYYSIGRKPVNV